MKPIDFKIIFAGLFLLILTACGSEPAPEDAVVVTAPAPAVSESTAEEEPTPADSLQSDSGAVSDAVIDTSITVADSLQLSTEQLIADNRVIVGDQGGDLQEYAAVVSTLTTVVEVSDFLATQPNWEAAAFKHEGYFSIQLRVAETNEYLGWGNVVTDGGNTPGGYFVARELSADEFAEGKAFMEDFVLGEDVVTGRLGDVPTWRADTSYRQKEGVWEVQFEKGPETVVVAIDSWEERYFIDDVYEVVTESTANEDQLTAIEIARSDEWVQGGLAARNDWRIYVAQQEGSVYAVSFTAPDRELFYVLADIDSGETLQVTAGFR